MASEDSMKRTVEANQKCFDSGHKEVLILCKRCFAAAIDEAVEDTKTEWIVEASKKVADKARTAAFREWEEKDWLQHRRDRRTGDGTGCELLSSTSWSPGEPVPQCTCGLDAERAKHKEE